MYILYALTYVYGRTHECVRARDLIAFAFRVRVGQLFVFYGICKRTLKFVWYTIATQID